MTKIFIVAVGILFSSQMAFAFTSMNCTDQTGRELSVKINGVETTIPYYDVVLKVNGIVAKSFEVAQKEDSPTQFLAETLTEEEGTITTVGYIYSTKEAFYQRSANGGMSPLPALFFNSCTLQ